MTRSPNAHDLVAPDRIDAVRAVDPLEADDACRRLPALNAAGDVTALAAELRSIVPAAGRVAALSLDEQLGAMRDLGIFLGSIKRAGAEPSTVVPEVVPVLTELGRRTAMVPRDTVHHYTTWNPVGHRRRSYTGDRQEYRLQDSVRMVMPELHEALAVCAALSDSAPDRPECAALLDELDGHLATMVQSIDMVAREVDPTFFARTLRPYFDEIAVGRRSFLGPAAAQVPLWLVDQLLWASDRADGTYAEFTADSVQYSLPRWRAYHHRWRRRPSLVSRIAVAAGCGDSPDLRRSAEALVRVLRTIMVFRGRHLGVARQAYRAQVRLFPTGSGGGTVELLQVILDLVRDNSLRTRRYAAPGGDTAAAAAHRDDEPGNAPDASGEQAAARRPTR